jgi:hypothetical protein
VQGVSFIAVLRMAPLSPRWCASDETYRASCGAQDTDKWNVLVGLRELLYLLHFNFIQGLKLQCSFSYYLRVNDDVRGLTGTLGGCLLNWEFNTHCHQQNFRRYYLSWLQSVHFLSLLRILKIDINIILRFTLNIRSLFLWLFLTRFFFKDFHTRIVHPSLVTLFDLMALKCKIRRDSCEGYCGFLNLALSFGFQNYC